MEVKKNKCGRPRKEPTYTKGFRLHKSLKDFFSSLENSNKFFTETITNTPEYKAFIAKRAKKDSKDINYNTIKSLSNDIYRKKFLMILTKPSLF